MEDAALPKLSASGVKLAQGRNQQALAAVGLYVWYYRGYLEPGENRRTQQCPSIATVHGAEHSQSLTSVVIIAELSCSGEDNELVDRRHSSALGSAANNGFTIGIQRADRNIAERKRRELVGQGSIVDSSVKASPYPSTHRGHKHHVRVRGRNGDRLDRANVIAEHTRPLFQP